MNCFDCGIEGRTVAAVGVCTSCGAGVCLSCAELETHVLPRPVSVGNATVEVTRAVTCRSCVQALRVHHAPYPAAGISKAPASASAS